jgi:hypothetical protein
LSAANAADEDVIARALRNLDKSVQTKCVQTSDNQEDKEE